MKGRRPFNIAQLSFVPSVDAKGGLAARPYCFFIFSFAAFMKRISSLAHCHHNSTAIPSLSPWWFSSDAGSFDGEGLGLPQSSAKLVLRLSKGSQGRTAETLRQNALKVTKVSHSAHKNTTNRCLVLIARDRVVMPWAWADDEKEQL